VLNTDRHFDRPTCDSDFGISGNGTWMLEWGSGGRQMAGTEREFFSNLSREVAVVVRERSKLKVGVGLGCRDDELNRLAKKRGLMQMKWAGTWEWKGPRQRGMLHTLKHRSPN
jgi:hypothetical protein